MNDIKKLIEDLKDMERGATEAARDLRYPNQKMSYMFFSIAETSRKAAEELESRLPVPAEVEGGGRCWFYVCGSCHTALNPRDVYCRVCGRKVEWE